jgi:hypothetical protein
MHAHDDGEFFFVLSRFIIDLEGTQSVLPIRVSIPRECCIARPKGVILMVETAQSCQLAMPDRVNVSI